MASSTSIHNPNFAELKLQIGTQQSRHKESELQRADLQRRLDEAQRRQTATDEELSDLRTVSAQSSGDLERCIGALRLENQQLQQRQFGMDEQAADWQAQLRATGEELDAMRTEFVAYKVRVSIGRWATDAA